MKGRERKRENNRDREEEKDRQRGFRTRNTRIDTSKQDGII